MTNLQAIDLLKGLEQSLDDYCELSDEGKTAFGMAITALELFGNSEQLPSAQPKKRTEERAETHACDLISRQAAIDAILAVTGNSSVRELYEHVQEHGLSEMWSGGVNAAIDIIIAVPSAQPEQTNSWCINSWCIDCKEYDTENKCCPRYNRVIKQTLDDAYRHGETEAEARFYAEIVRCKDCKHSQGCGYPHCNRVTFWNGEDDYCSRAERRTDET